MNSCLPAAQLNTFQEHLASRGQDTLVSQSSYIPKYNSNQNHPTARTPKGTPFLLLNSDIALPARGGVWVVSGRPGGVPALCLSVGRPWLLATFNSLALPSSDSCGVGHTQLVFCACVSQRVYPSSEHSADFWWVEDFCLVDHKNSVCVAILGLVQLSKWRALSGLFDGSPKTCVALFASVRSRVDG